MGNYGSCASKPSFHRPRIKTNKIHESSVLKEGALRGSWGIPDLNSIRPIYHEIYFFKQTRCSINIFVIYSFINSLCPPFVQNLQYTVNSKQWLMGSWNFERMFNPTMCPASRVPCHMSGVRCQFSGVTCQVLSAFFLILKSGWASRWRVCFH